MYKCKYIKCKFGGDVNENIAVKYKNKYYHPECLQEMLDKEEIKILFLKYINPLEVHSALNRNIDNIIHKKNVSSEFLLFALKYVIKNKMILNYSGGLHYIIGNIEIRKAYEDTIMRGKAKKIIEKVKDLNNFKQTEFKHKEYKTPGWGNITER